MGKRFVAFLFVIVVAAALLTGCRQSDRVSYNVSKEADNFNVTRRLVAINTRTDKPVLEIIGNFALSNNDKNELEIIVEVAPGNYKKHFVYLNEWITYTVEDVSGVFVDQYHYEVNFLPQMIPLLEYSFND